MFKIKYFIILFFISTISILNAQPYYYVSVYKPFPFGHHGTGDIYRINMNNSAEVETLMTNVYDMEWVSSDESGNWLAYEENFELFIVNSNNLNHKNMITKYCEDLRKFSFTSAINKLVAKYSDSLSFKMVLIDPASLLITDTIPYDIHWDCAVDKDINFSGTGNMMYLIKGDSILLKPKIASYSFLTKQIISTKYIDEISYPGADDFYFSFVRNGLSIIESLFSLPTSLSYYQIYFLDKDSLSIPIIRSNSESWAYGYVANEGNYLLLFNSQVNPDSLGHTYTGKIEIYNMTNGELKKTIQLPPDGQVMCFENYPNNVYYVKDIELPTRQVWNLDMDSIFNVLDLTILNPNSVNINSNSFTLTVNGKGFDTVSTVYFNGQPKTTTFISDSVIVAEILSSDVSSLGTFPVWVKDRYSISDTLQFSVTQANNPNLLVNLKNSLGNQIPASNVMYYESATSGWKDAVNNGDGTFTVITTKPTVSIRMFYEYANQTVHNITAHNNTYTFHTVNASVELRNSSGNLIDQGTVQYYAGAWRTFGTTQNGVANKELLPINYSFRMTYEYAPLDKQQDISTNSTVTFSTVLCTVKVTKTNGQALSGAGTKYYSGAWRDIGLTNTNGETTKELLPKSLNFRATSGSVSQDKQQDISVNNLVEIQLNVP
ncbi:MAG: IPT/TIG domain-containing protein [Ignavibacterium sp.]|nr:IPT/TIG domain-containing protein [Ignavibacterium sp.]